MKKTIKVLTSLFIGTAAFVFVLYLAILAAFPLGFNSELFKGQIEKEFHKQTGLTLKIEDISAKTSISPYINLDAKHVGIWYPNKEELLKVKSMNIKIKVLPILMKRICIEKISADRPIIAFSIDSHGKSTIDKYLNFKPDTNADFSGFKFVETFPSMNVDRYKIKIYDKRYRKPFLIEGDKLTFASIPFSKDVKVNTKGTLSQNGTTYIKYNTLVETPVKEIPTPLFNSNPFGYFKQYQLKANVDAKLKLKEQNNKIKPYGTASINNLSFILDNVLLANNYINVKLDNNKIDIDADIQTGKNNRMKVVGIYNNGKNKNVDLSVKANNADISTLKDTAETIMNAFNVKQELSKYKASGKINLDFKIKSDFKTLYSQGIAEIFNATISGKAIPYKVTDINSRINFSNNSIKIEPSKMLVNGTPITIQGNVDNKTNVDIIAKGTNLDAKKISELFFPQDLKQKLGIEGIISFDAKVTGTMKEPKTGLFVSFKDFTVISKKVIVTKFKSGIFKLTGTLDKPKGDLTLTNATFLPKEFNNELGAKQILLEITPKEINLPKNTVTLAQAPILIEGTIKDYSETPSFDLTVNGKLKSDTMYSFLKQTGALKDIQAATKGYIKVDGKFTGKGDEATVKATFNADAHNYISAVVIRELLNQPSVTTIDAVVNGKNLAIKDITLCKDMQNGFKDKIISINGNIKNIDNPTLDNLKIVVPKAMTFSIAQFKNSEITIKSDLNLNGKPENPVIRGFLDVQNINIPEYKLKSKTNEISFSKDNIRVFIPKLEIGKSKFCVNADMNPALTGKIKVKNFNFESDYLDLDELNQSFEDTQSNPIYPGFSVPINLPKGTALIKVFKTGAIQAENITCDVSLTDNVLKMTNIKGRAYNGSVSGKSEYNILHTTTMTDVVGTGANVQPLLSAFTGKKDKMTGSVDYKVKLNTVGTKQIQQMRSAKGYVEFTAKRGTMGPLGQFEHFLYAQNLISQSLMKMTTLSVIKAVRPQNTGNYTVAKGKIEISRGNLNLKVLTVEGQNMSLYMTGKINILNDLADLKIYGRISQQVENVLGDLTNPIPKTIMSTSSETSIGNLFYDEYNTKLPKALTDAIPNLNPATGLSSRMFTVTIQGSPDSIKAVKSFKWVIGTTSAPTPNARKTTPTQPNAQQVQQLQPAQTQPTQTQPTQSQPQQNLPTQLQERNEQDIYNDNVPDFMKNLPDNFN